MENVFAENVVSVESNLLKYKSTISDEEYIQGVNESSFASILTGITPIPSNDEESICAYSICLEQYSDSNSAASIDNTYYFKQKIIEDPKIFEYMECDYDHKKIGWDKYTFDCKKYSLAPIKSLESCFNGKPVLNLKNYNPKSVGIQLVCDSMCGPPIIPLTHIDFTNSTFSQNGCVTLSNFIEQNSTIKHLNLTNCRIGITGGDILSNSLANSKSLVDINLSKCDLNDSGGAIIIKSMKLNTICLKLNLSYNLLHIQSGLELGRFLRKNNTIEHLNLEWNNLYPEEGCIISLLNGLIRNKSLTELNLSWNGLNGNAFMEILQKAITQHPKLKILYLKYNRINGTPTIDMLANGLRESKSLNDIYLDGNPLDIDDINILLKIFFDNPNFKLMSFGEHIWLPKGTIDIIENIKRRDSSIEIISKGCLPSNEPDECDFSAVLIDRCKFLAMKPKKIKLKKNMGDFFVKLLESDVEYYTKDEFIDMIKNFKAKLDDDLINHIAENWIVEFGKGRNKIRKVNGKTLANDYLKRHRNVIKSSSN